MNSTYLHERWCDLLASLQGLHVQASGLRVNDPAKTVMADGMRVFYLQLRKLQVECCNIIAEFDRANTEVTAHALALKVDSDGETIKSYFTRALKDANDVSLMLSPCRHIAGSEERQQKAASKLDALNEVYYKLMPYMDQFLGEQVAQIHWPEMTVKICNPRKKAVA